MMRTILVGILVIMVATVGWLTFDWYRQQYSGEAYGTSFSLIDENGKPITEAAFRGQPTLLYFGYTHCPEVCPTTLFELDGWLKKLGPQAADMKAYFISIDPERDTPEVMSRYVGNFSKRIGGISGPPDKVQAMAKGFNIYFHKVPTSDGDYTMDHTASVILLDRHGDFAGTIPYGTDEAQALEKLTKLEAGA